MADTINLTLEAARQWVRNACLKVGNGADMAEALAAALISAEAHGKRSLGLARLPDYLDSMIAGRINCIARPKVDFPAPAIIRIDADGAIAQWGFDLAFDEACKRARNFGVVILASTNSYTTGELGYYARRLAEAGLVALAASNGPALMTVPGGRKPVYCTNPVAFAAPMAAHGPLVIDQASSATAFANIREAASKGEDLPEGWAIDADGHPTTSASEAVKGALLAFGGRRGANIALMVEVLAAGMTGANWSLDSPSFQSGHQSPGAGLFVVAMQPEVIDPDFARRLLAQSERLATESVHVPGENGNRAFERAQTHGIDIQRALFDRLDTSA